MTREIVHILLCQLLKSEADAQNKKNEKKQCLNFKELGCFVSESIQSQNKKKFQLFSCKTIKYSQKFFNVNPYLLTASYHIICKIERRKFQSNNTPMERV